MRKRCCIAQLESRRDRTSSAQAKKNVHLIMTKPMMKFFIPCRMSCSHPNSPDNDHFELVVTLRPEF
jgi:hypothetical protein